MHSSTSSSDANVSNHGHAMLKSFLLFLGLAVAYSLYIALANPAIVKVQTEAQENYIRAQEYIYSKDINKNVVVGSSMAARLKMDEMTEPTVNLAFVGGSSLTGLELIRRSGKIPHKILVETNIIFKAGDEDLLERLFTPVVVSLKEKVRSLRDLFQPVNVLLSKFSTRTTPSWEKTYVNEVDREKLAERLERRLKKNNDPKTTLVSKNKEINQLKDLIDYFKSKGTKIVMFQMPVEPEMLETLKVETEE